ncbi:MAG: sucrase ferredoxin [Actinomycetota bacterium]
MIAAGAGATATSHARSKPDACSVIWDRAQAPVLGTAAGAMFWVALEQSGPWGRDAATQSRLPPEVGAALGRGCQENGGRLLLIRRPGAHSNARQDHKRRVYLAGGLTDRPWLLEADIEDPALLLRLPWAAFRDGDKAAVRERLPELRESSAPVLMICANSKRDLCCAVRGRPVAIETSLKRPGQVWECSHTGGHRFAPTGVVLPHGQTLARLSATSAVAVVDAAARDEVPVELLGSAYDRGRSHLSAAAQAAESMVRQRVQEPNLLALATTAAPHPHRADAWLCTVRHVDGRHWDVVAVRGPGAEDRPESCGKMPVPTWEWSVLSGTGR